MWSDQQSDALAGIKHWLRHGNEQVYRLFGYAGTGKTTLAREIGGLCDGDVLYAAFTGKAAQVLSQRVEILATTLHRLIYYGGQREPRVAELNARKAELEEWRKFC